jgi:hypothetical protein
MSALQGLEYEIDGSLADAVNLRGGVFAFRVQI